jgi:predicted GNAT superfamily acetyltransferase
VATEIRLLESLEELALVDALFGQIWGATGSQVAMPVNLLRALIHSGNYVSGAWQGQRLIGAAVAWLGEHDGSLELHSHVAGVARDAQDGGAGLALKLHQRAWALGKGVHRITWTYDPLIRKNGYFNLVKLGATAVSFYPNFYGLMVDELNGTDETDRCLVRWDLDRAWPPPPTDRDESDVFCEVPDDIVALRRSDPAAAARWRSELRATMGRAMGAGYVATSITPDGRYVLRRGPS